jgi:predicted nucleic acid-binding protein
VKNTVLDASALLALLFDEPGAEKVENLFNQSAEADKSLLITAVNWAEVLYRMSRKRGEGGLEAARRFERTMPLEVAVLDRDLAESAAALKSKHGLGLADAFAVALAKSKGKSTELVTGDLELKPLETEIKIVWLK